MSYLLIEVTEDGFIRSMDSKMAMLHKETRNIQDRHVTTPTLSEAKERITRRCHALLKLTKEGGGQCIWMYRDQADLLLPRLKAFKSCYGGWTVRYLEREET